MAEGGLIAVSGFFESDLEDLCQSFANQGLLYESHRVEQGWCCAVFQNQWNA